MSAYTGASSGAGRKFSSGGGRSFGGRKRFGGRSSSEPGASFSGRPSHGGSSYGGGHSSHSTPRSFGGRTNHRGNAGRGGGSGGARHQGQYINPAKFVNKAVAVLDAPIFTPTNKFSDFEMDPEVKAAVAAKGYVLPTPIQDQAIPHILKGSDVVGIANTGTGKTAAFLVPLINLVRTNPAKRVMVVVPTRELALQIQEELRGLTKGMKIFSVCCVGGAPIGPQLSALKFNNQFIIGTPGRLKDLIERRKINLAQFSTIVLDEADRMLDMGFVHDMRYLMAGMPQGRHTLFFSATMSKEIQNLIGEFLTNPQHVSVRTKDTAEHVDQDVVSVPKGTDKFNVLHDLLIQKDFNKVLVFGRTKHGVEKLSKTLVERGFKAESIHGNKTHGKRQRALGLFKTDKVQILVATDVAARGLDIPDVSHVINYDLPATYEDYVHRIGRTGRGSKFGKALTFIE